MRLSPTWKSAGVDGLQLLDVGLIDMADLDIEDVFTLHEASHNVIASSVLPVLMHNTQNPYPVRIPGMDFHNLHKVTLKALAVEYTQLRE